jgi:hypothetical protein
MAELIPIDMKKVDDLLIAGCTGTQVAGYFGVHPDTLYNRIVSEKGMTFTAYSAIKRQKGESILKATQFAKAIGASDKGDNMMLIWLGKNRLDQTDSPKQDASAKDEQITEVLSNAKENTRLREENTRIIEENKKLKEKYEPETRVEHIPSE